jgi:hypothetical protein
MMYLNKAFSVAPVAEKPEMIFKLNASPAGSFGGDIAQGLGKI